jgi:hypothetical protein
MCLPRLKCGLEDLLVASMLKISKNTRILWRLSSARVLKPNWWMMPKLNMKEWHSWKCNLAETFRRYYVYFSVREGRFQCAWYFW